MARLSGLQKQVLALYRKCLRASGHKPKETRIHFQNYARSEFEKGVHLDKKDFGAIEYLIRKGERQLEMCSSPGIKDIRR